MRATSSKTPAECSASSARASGVPLLTRQCLPGPQGAAETDGIWAKHWYESVEKTTSFQPYTPKNEPVPEPFQGLLELCQSYYETLHSERLGR